MIYLMGFIGFLFGFLIGQITLAYLLRGKTRTELTTDKSLRIYGILNWAIAIMMCGIFIYIHKTGFLT